MKTLQVNSYNLDVAKVFGVRTSVFLTCIDYEQKYQERNKMLGTTQTMSISRAEIYARTGLDDEEQKEIELALNECGVLASKPLQNIPNKNYYILNYEHFNKIMESENPLDVIESSSASQFVKKARVEPVSKRQARIIDLKKKVKIKDPIIQQYFCDWIDAIYTSQRGFLSPKGIEIAQEELLAYAPDNVDKQVKIMRTAVKLGISDMTRIIQRYEKDYGVGTDNFTQYNDMVAKVEIDETETF